MRPITSYKADGTPVPPNGQPMRNDGLPGRTNTGLTPAERQRLVERHFETAAYRQAEANLNLLAAIQLGQRLKDS